MENVLSLRPALPLASYVVLGKSVTLPRPLSIYQENDELGLDQGLKSVDPLADSDPEQCFCFHCVCFGEACTPIWLSLIHI